MGRLRLGKHNVLARNFEGTSGSGLWMGAGFPKSGTSGSTVSSRLGVGAKKGAVYVDTDTGTSFLNVGSAASPYWVPTSFDQPGLIGWYTDFRDGAGKALADTAATATLIGSGIRIHGQGIAETDSGVVVAMTEDGPVASLTVTDEDEHTAVLSVGTGTSPVFQPDLNEVLVVDANISHSSAITLRGLFFGFGGSAADALDPMANGSTTTISFANSIADDIAGLFFDVGLTDGDRYFAIHDKANTNASIATTATGVDTGVDVAAAGTYQRLRVEVDEDGAVRMFIDKAQVASFAAATLDTDEELHPILQLISESAATKTLLVKSFSAWGKRP